jgi:hypothetical protein
MMCMGSGRMYKDEDVRNVDYLDNADPVLG